MTAKPPILSADDIELKVGRNVYYVQECCRGGIYNVHTAKVIDIDLGAKREVRVRKHLGREIVISVSSRSGLCQHPGLTHEVLFGKKEPALELARMLSQPAIDKEEERIAGMEYDVTTDIEQEIADLKSRKTWRRKQLATAKKDLVELKKRAKAAKPD